MQKESLVLVRDEWGVYLGSCMGFGFWTKIDPVGSLAAIAFDNEAAGIQHIRRLNADNDPAMYRFVPVLASINGFATIDDLKRAGLNPLLGDMEANAAEHSITVGSA